MCSKSPPRPFRQHHPAAQLASHHRHKQVALTQGWIGTPLDQSTVTGAVPITLAQGVTLASGTLSYSPTTDTTKVYVLNANTAGSGQIGVLDTTLLADGSYWVELYATDTNGNTQNNLAMVKVIGDYKPGRVNATVTDLQVPAPAMPFRSSDLDSRCAPLQRLRERLDAGVNVIWRFSPSTTLRSPSTASAAPSTSRPTCPVTNSPRVVHP